MKRTVSPLVLFVIGASCMLVLAMFSAFGGSSDEIKAFVASVGSVAITAVCAAVILAVASSFGKKEPWRRQWLLVGFGVAASAAGHLVQAVEMAASGAVSRPGMPDVFYISEYLLLGAAFVAVAQSYSGIIDVRRPAAGAIVVGALGIASLWVGIVVPYVLPDVTSSAEALRTVFYPLADVVLLLVPGVCVALSVAQLGGGRFARPWFAVAAGAAVLAFSDAGIVYLTATGNYLPGSFVDYGPMLAQVLIAMGALMAARIAEEFMSPVIIARAETAAVESSAS